jgi:hypothetical protein
VQKWGEFDILPIFMLLLSVEYGCLFFKF